MTVSRNGDKFLRENAIVGTLKNKHLGKKEVLNVSDRGKGHGGVQQRANVIRKFKAIPLDEIEHEGKALLEGGAEGPYDQSVRKGGK